jgi:hypothetical protein
MSASNWVVCPRCKRRHHAKVVAAIRVADEAYGKVSLEDWKKLVSEADALDTPFGQSTFREDYEIYGAETGEISVSYEGQCAVCRLSLSFTQSVPIEGIEE